MACGHGEQFQRSFPARISYRLYFNSERTTVPARWDADELWVCLCCGEITATVPPSALSDLQRDLIESL